MDASCEYQVHQVSWDPIAAEKGEYRHFMQKEIHEQVRSLTDTIAGRVDFEKGRVRLPELNLTPEHGPGHREDLHHRLRHGSACRDGRQGAHRAHCPHPGGGGHRLRISLPRSDRGGRNGRAGDQPVWRDGGYAGSHGGGAAQRGDACGRSSTSSARRRCA